MSELLQKKSKNQKNHSENDQMICKDRRDVGFNASGLENEIKLCWNSFQVLVEFVQLKLTINFPIEITTIILGCSLVKTKTSDFNTSDFD